MPSHHDGVMIILSSPSGAGKTTLVKMLSNLDNFEISISHTTRQPRPNEKPNDDYFFVNEEEFRRFIKNEEFLEYAKVFNNFYGTTRTPVIDKLNKGKNVLFDIDWQGADQIKNKKLDYKLITFFIRPPSREVLFDRLSRRHENDKLIAEERMKQFERDVLHWINYDYVVINNDLNECAKAQNVEIKQGDFVIVRTGQMEQRLDDGEWGGYAGGDAPGLAFETAEWIYEKEIAAICTDTWGCEVRPNETKDAQQPWHWVVIPMIGITMGEIFYLRELAKDCEEDKIYDFFFCAPPLPITKAVGSPINPMAIK